MALILLVLVGGGAVALTARLRQPDAAGTVRDYFAALAAGNAKKALRYVSAAAPLSAQDYPLLTDAALSSPRNRPSNAKTSTVTQIQGTPSSIEAYLVLTSYRVAGQPVTTVLVVLHGDGRYLLRSPFAEVAVMDAAGRAVTVNGVALDQQHLTTPAFPGSYDAVAAGNALYTAGRASAVSGSGAAALSFTQIDFEPPALAPGALGEIQRQARAELDACTASGQPAPDGCPFGLNVPGTAAQVKWTITTYPAITAAVAASLRGDVGVAVTDDHTGRVHWDVTYTGLDGVNRHQTGDSDFTVNGSASLAGSAIQVSLAG